MNKLLHSHAFHIGIAAVLIIIALSALIGVLRDSEPEWITSTVTRGTVANIVSVSGVVEADNKAEIAFSVTGKVASVPVKEGDQVTTGDVLISLEQAALQAERRDVYASLLIAQANRDELISGPSTEERAITNTSVAIAEENLARTIAENEEKVANAYRTLLSTSLEALPVDSSNDDIAPTISGTYICDTAGIYTLSIFPSAAQSGYSYRLSGLETGTYTGYTETPSPLGTCGLSIQFVDGETYGRKTWEIAIPNTRSSSYATNLNAYELALQLQTNSVSATEQALDLALQNQTLDNASPRDEALQRANASVMQAAARLAAVDARIADRTVTAPFSGTVTDIHVLPGESVTTLPVVTVLAENNFELTARIPEIDITKIVQDQEASIVFDARSDKILTSHIIFVSPLALEIDGVAYFEAKLRIDEPPTWIRSGLNADIDIIVDKREDTLRIPRRFLIEEDDKTYVLVPNENTTIEKPIEVGFIGNDGYVEITGLNEGDTVVAP